MPPRSSAVATSFPTGILPGGARTVDRPRLAGVLQLRSGRRFRGVTGGHPDLVPSARQTGSTARDLDSTTDDRERALRNSDRRIEHHRPAMNELPQRILLVDDEPGLLEALRVALERAGREVVACRTFDDAREKLLTERFDVLVTDVRLGAFNGLQLAIIARSRAADMRIIVFSGFDDPVLKEEASGLGAQYLVKPVSAEALLEHIG